MEGRPTIVTGASRGIGRLIATRFARADATQVMVARGSGLLGFSRALAVELPRYNIRVRAICPGAVDAPLWNGFGKLDRARMLRDEDVAEAVLWVASEPERVNVEAMVIGHVKGDL